MFSRCFQRQAHFTGKLGGNMRHAHFVHRMANCMHQRSNGIAIRIFKPYRMPPAVHRLLLSSSGAIGCRASDIITPSGVGMRRCME